VPINANYTVDNCALTLRRKKDNHISRLNFLTLVWNDLKYIQRLEGRIHAGPSVNYSLRSIANHLENLFHLFPAPTIKTGTKYISRDDPGQLAGIVKNLLPEFTLIPITHFPPCSTMCLYR